MTLDWKANTSIPQVRVIAPVTVMQSLLIHPFIAVRLAQPGISKRSVGPKGQVLATNEPHSDPCLEEFLYP